tara:strand:+ start:1277 stop:2332 length:1056 start_codon:yes stop_codon:yes gene_type:complete
MIKTLSPYYKNIPWEYLDSGNYATKYILNIYVWSGLKADVPTNPTIEQENINPLGRTDSTDINISRFVNGFLNINLPIQNTTSLTDANSMVWVKTQVIYYIGGVARPPELEETTSAVKGYTYGIEGSNISTPANKYLATTIEQKVSKTGVYLFSFLGSETVSTVITLSGETITKTFTKTASTNSIDLIQSVYVDVAEFDGNYIEISKDGVLINTLLVTDEPTFDPIDLVFANKEGQLQTVTFFKEKITKLNVDRQNYESSAGQPLNGVHQFKDFNVNGRESFTMNSGFVREDNNEIFTQLLLSRRVWQLKDSVYIPLNLGTNDIEYKSRNKDRLINYKIDFKYSFSKINNI